MMRRVKHQIRQAYGYTDEQIIDHIGEYGEEWAIDSYQLIMEDQNMYWQMMVAALPMARTPSDKKYAKSIQRYAKDLRRSIERTFAPWIEHKRIKALRERLARPPESAVYDERGNKVDLSDPNWWKKEV